MEDTSEKQKGVLKILHGHWLAVFAAILFGVLLAGPFMLVASRDSFTGVYPELANDQNFYLSRIQDVRDGFPMSGNTYIAEDKNVPPMNFLTGEIIEAKILDVFHLPTHAGLILFPLLFGPFIFLLTYAIFVSLGAPRLWALLAALFLIFGNFEHFMRPISPQFNFTFWLLSVLALIRFAARPTWIQSGLLAISVGVLFYLYPYYWTHLFAACGVLFLWLLFKNRSAALKLAAAGIGAAVLAIPYVVLIIENRSLPEFAESMTRLGFIETHMPSGIMMLIGSGFLLSAVFFIARKLKTHSAGLIAMFALLSGALLAMNQHVVTGINMEFSSHYAQQIMFGNLFLAVAALSAFGFWARMERAVVKAGAVVLVLLIAVPPVLLAHAEAARYAAEDKTHTEYGILFKWLNENAAPEDVVYADELTAFVIPAYTRQNVFFARNANIAFMPDSEVIDRLILQNYHAEFTQEFISENERQLLGHGSINANGHALQKQKVLGLFGIAVDVPDRVPEDTVLRVQKRAEELRRAPFEEALSPYRVDYFVIRKSAAYALTPEDLAFASRVFETENFTVYKK